MKTFVAVALFCLGVGCAPLMAQQRNAPVDAPFVLEHTYWIKRGETSRFVKLFEQNKLPLLQDEAKEGRILWIRFSEPRLRHGAESWDFRLTIAWRSAAVAWDDKDPSRFVSRHYADPATHRELEALRESLVLKRTDVPVQERIVVSASGT